MRILLTLALLLLCLCAEASTVITATIAITNTAGTTNGQTLTVNSDVRRWTNSVSIPASQILTNSTPTGAANNLLTHVAIHPFSGLQLYQSGATNIVLRAAPDAALSASVSAGWATVTLITNTLGLGIVVRVPPAIENGPEQTNIWSQVAGGLINSTNPITLNTGGTNIFFLTTIVNGQTNGYAFQGPNGLMTMTNNGAMLTNLQASAVSGSIPTLATNDGGSLSNLNLSIGWLPTNALASWPAAAQTRGGAAFVNSNSTVYLLLSAPNSTAWTSTNALP